MIGSGRIGHQPPTVLPGGRGGGGPEHQPHFILSFCLPVASPHAEAPQGCQAPVISLAYGTLLPVQGFQGR